MKKNFPKFIALMIALAMMMSMAGCSVIDSLKTTKPGRVSSEKDEDEDEDDDDDDEDDEDEKAKPTKKPSKNDDKDDDDDEPVETETTEPEDDVIVEKESAGLPEIKITDIQEEPYDYDKVHPYHAPGDVTGDEAIELLNEIELEFLRSELTNYVDVTLMLEDYEALGIEYDGITYGEVDFEDITLEDFEEDLDWLEQLYSIDYESLEGNDRILYDKMVFDLEEGCFNAQFTENQYMLPIFNSFTSLQCDLFFILDVMDFKTVEDAENYITLIESLSPYFDDLCKFEEIRINKGYGCSDTAYEGVAESFDNLVAQEEDCFLYESFEFRLENIDGLTDDEKADLITRHESAMRDSLFPKLQEVADRIRGYKGKCKNPLGLYYVDGGTEYYASIFRAKSNSLMTPEEAAEIMDEEIYDLLYEYALGTPLSQDLSVGNVNENLDFLYDKIFEFFPEVPAHSYTLRDVPEVFADSFSPAAYLGFHLDNYDSNLILINTASSHDNFGTTVAHEGYPGHMYQSLYTRSATDHPYLIFLNASGYKEGWAQYVEIFSGRFFGANEEEMTTYSAETLLNVYLMARIDIGVNYEGWDSQDAADHFSELFGMQVFVPTVFDEILEIVVADPGYPLPYAFGYYNTNAIISKMFDEHPEMSEKEIFETYLNAMPVTYEMIDAYCEKTLG